MSALQSPVDPQSRKEHLPPPAGFGRMGTGSSGLGDRCPHQLWGSGVDPRKNFMATHAYARNSSGDDSERELALRRHCTRTKNTINSYINSATDRFLQRRFTNFSEITQRNGHYDVQRHRFWYQSKAHIRLPVSD